MDVSEGLGKMWPLAEVCVAIMSVDHLQLAGLVTAELCIVVSSQVGLMLTLTIIPGKEEREDKEVRSRQGRGIRKLGKRGDKY